MTSQCYGRSFWWLSLHTNHGGEGWDWPGLAGSAFLRLTAWSISCGITSMDGYSCHHLDHPRCSKNLCELLLWQLKWVSSQVWAIGVSLSFTLLLKSGLSRECICCSGSWFLHSSQFPTHHMAQWTGTHSPASQPLPAPKEPKVMGFLKPETGTAGIKGANKGAIHYCCARGGC